MGNKPKVPWNEKIMILLTLIAIFASSYFSLRSNQQTEAQMKQTEEQLKLAQSQYKSGREKDSTDEIKRSKAEKVEQERYARQSEITTKNLEALEMQAKNGERQYLTQLQAIKDQAYQNRPVFKLAKVEYDNVSKMGIFTIKNVGKRTARIVKCTFYGERKQPAAEIITTVKTSFELGEFEQYELALDVNEEDLQNPESKYILVMDYMDFGSEKPKNFLKYFKVKFDFDGNIGWQELRDEEKYELYSRITGGYYDREIDPMRNAVKIKLDN
jgi:hypothetical protein